jgi:aryl-alcohol dehydrogenase-like predicted oxidoreductase
MRYNHIGTSTINASKIILGTWQAGKNMWADIDDRETSKAIRGALDLGINTIDTAAVYGDGHSERVIATALKEVAREQYYIATKVFSNKLKHDQVIAECEKSLKNLQTDYIDLYQIHWPAGSFDSEIVPIQETMAALNFLKEEEKILNIGVSNFSKAQIEEAMQYGDIVSNQPPYSLIWRPYDQETNPFCRARNIAILAYSPLAQGILTGKFHKNHKFHKDDHRARNKFMDPKAFSYVEKVLAGLQPFAKKYDTSIGNIALHWLISRPHTFAIVGARNLEQVQDNVKCCEFTMTHEELIAIDTLSEIVTKSMEQSGTMWG